MRKIGNWTPEQRHGLLLEIGRQADSAMQDEEFMSYLLDMNELIGIVPDTGGNFVLTRHDLVRLSLLIAAMYEIGGQP